MKQGYHFAAYDRHFRQDQQSILPTPWSIVRHDLMLQSLPMQPFLQPAGYSPCQSNNEYEDGFQNSTQGENYFQKQQPSYNKEFKIPKGYCIFHHREDKDCRNARCRFSHSCPKCQQGHPAYACRQNQRYWKSPHWAINVDRRQPHLNACNYPKVKSWLTS